MGQVQHARIKSRLLELVAPTLDVSDLTPHKGAALEKLKLSRAIGATAVRLSAEVDDTTAAQAIVDGTEDNRLDAIYFDLQARTLLVVQAKWNEAHASSIDVAGVLKFIQGVKDLRRARSMKRCASAGV